MNKAIEYRDNSGVVFLYLMFDNAYTEIIFTWPKTLFLDRYYFHRRGCVCVSVSACVSVFIRFISKSSRSILMKLDRMMYNDNVQVPFEDELNRLIRTEVTENPYLYFFLLRPFDDFFLRLLPFFII